MGTLQQSFNQALTGATFLLQQTPGWQRRSEQVRAVGEYGQARKALGSLREEAAGRAEGIKEEYEAVPQEQQSKEWTEKMLKKTGKELKHVTGLEEGMDISVAKMQNILRENPSLLIKTPGALTVEPGRFNKASQEVARIKRELETQTQQQDEFREALKKLRKFVDEGEAK